MVNAEVRNFLHEKRDQIMRAQKKKLKNDPTLEKDNISNF